MWKLKSKKETIARMPYKCKSCDKDFPAGAYVKNYLFQNEDKYETKKICENCEKYYRREDLKHEGNTTQFNN